MADAETQRKAETIPEWKRSEVDDLTALIERYDTVGVVSIGGIPSRQLQEMRRNLHGTAELRVSRNTLLRRALEAAGFDALVDHVAGQVGLIGTDDNPFGLYRKLEASKTPAPINAGEITPTDIVIPAGDTGVDDGQFIGDLKRVGVDSRFQEGSVHVTDETVALAAGEEVSEDLANVLSTLGIEPKEVGLDLRAVVSDGIVFGPEELDIDVDAYRADLQAAVGLARHISIAGQYPTRRTAGALFAKARADATAIGTAGAIESPDILSELIGQADARIRAVAAKIEDEEALPDELRGVESPEPTDQAGGDDDEGESAGTDAQASDAAQDAPGDEEEDEDGDGDEDDGDAAAGLGDMFG